MRKELLIAILLGLGLGLVITYGFYRARRALTTPDYNAIVLEESSPTPEASALGTLSIVTPTDELLTAESELTVTGTTLANLFVIIFVNNKEYLTTSDTTGNFAQPISLENGSNIIVVHAVEENGASTVAERTVIRAATTTSSTATASATPTATSSARR